MTALQQIQAIFQTAEASLAELAAERVAKRDFDGATAAIEAARKLAGLLTGAPSGGIMDSAFTAETPLPIPPDEKNLTIPKTISQRAALPRKGDYPKFIREDDTLVKIGWSKSEKSEYEHKSPRKVLGTLVPALSKVGGSGKRFVMEKVLPLKDSDGTEIPDYQTYLCLAWLRALGVAQQHGRQGYTLPKKTDLAAAVDAAWEQLPRR